jgi:hypothetical protein
MHSPISREQTTTKKKQQCDILAMNEYLSSQNRLLLFVRGDNLKNIKKGKG